MPPLEFPTISDLISMMEKHKVSCEELLRAIEVFLDTLQNSKHIKYWEEQRKRIEREIKKTDKSLEALKKTIRDYKG